MQIDFLSAPFEPQEGFGREGRRFITRKPWMRVSFGVHPLEGGWWTLECDADASPTGTEIQLSSPADPLIMFEADRAGSTRIRIARRTGYDISLLISPWPGAWTFKTLRLYRTGSLETASVLMRGGLRLLGRDKPLTRIRNLLGRLASGQPIGVGLGGQGGSSPPTSTQDVTSPDVQVDSIAKTIDRVEQGIRIRMLEGDELHPQAIDIAKEAFASNPSLHAIHADTLERDTLTPKPEWDPELAQSGDMLGHPVFLREPGAAQQSQRIALPLVRRSRPERYNIPTPPAPQLDRWPKVSALVPTKFRTDLLEKCLTSLADTTDYPDLEVIVIDNGSEDSRLAGVLAAAGKRLKLRHIIDARPFNYPRLNAVGEEAASGDVLLLLNDDIQAIEPGWLKRMVASAMRVDVGAVGARLLYPDRTIQHAGVMLGLGGVCGHMWKGLSEARAALIPQVMLPSSRLAVTAACLAVRREAYRAAGGLDQALGVALNDIDFCLRLHAKGLKTIYRGDAVLVHHESQTRGADNLTAAKRLRLASETEIFLSRWKTLIDHDPYGSPAFNPASETGEVRRSLLAAWRTP